MKLHQHTNQALNTVTAYGDGYIEINAIRHEGAIRFMPEGRIERWPPTAFATLGAADFEHLLEAAPEILLIGTGARQQFPRPEQLAPLVRAGIGHEVMTTASACRTYNILMAEGRRVMAALLPITP